MSAPQTVELDPGAGRRSGRRLNPSLVVGGLLVLLVVAMALVSFVWTPYDPTLVDPTSRLLTPSAQHWLGTDKFGRDVLSQIMVGARTTLFVGVRRRRRRRRDRRAARHPRGDGARAGSARS